MIKIENCEFAFKCPKDWKELVPDEALPTVRHCDECKRPVYQCQTDDELQLRAKKGHCVAIYRPDENEILFGAMKIDPRVTGGKLSWDD